MSVKTGASSLLDLVNGKARGMFWTYKDFNYSEPVLSLKANKELKLFLKRECRQDLCDIPFEGCLITISRDEIRWVDQNGSGFVYRPERYKTSPFIARNLKEIVRMVLSAGKSRDQKSLKSLQRLYEEVSALYAPFLRQWWKSANESNEMVDIDSLESLKAYCDSIWQSISAWLEHYKAYYQYSWSLKDDILLTNGLRLSEFGLTFKGTTFRDLLAADFLEGEEGNAPVQDTRAVALKSFIEARKQLIESLSLSNVRNVLVMFDKITENLELSDPNNAKLIDGMKSAIHTMINHS